MAKKAATKPAAKRKPRNAIVDNAPQIAELAKRMEAERARIIAEMAAEMAAEEGAKKKPVDGSPVILDSVVWDVDADVFKIGKDSEIKLSDFEQALKKQLTELGYDKDPVKSSSLWRRLLFGGAVVAGMVVSFGGGVWSAGGIDVGPKPKNDIVSKVFYTQEAAFRELSAERAKALRAGEITSESASVAWMSSRFLPKAESAWTPLLTAEKAAFGGEQWAAEKEATHIEEYAR